MVARLALAIIGALTIFCLGSLLGYYLRNSQNMTEEAVQIARYGELLDNYRIQGPDAAYEAILYGYLIFLESRMKHNSLWLSKKVWATDVAMTYARLATLAERHGDTGEAQRLTKLSESYCPQTRLSNCTFDTLLELIRKLDGASIQ